MPVTGDLADSKALFDGMFGANYLIHAAADTDHGSMDNQNQNQKRSNLDGTQNVYTQAKKAGIERVIHLSSEAVLLTGKPLINANEKHPIPEIAAGGYSKTKAQAEKSHWSFLVRRWKSSLSGLALFGAEMIQPPCRS
jgi:nucleoside-diphosphate-sugar epimerase